ncbi:MAG: polysaccharide deacetylase family protein [Firmicutes bacterium]|nr:polysaccharide deacetylase family protein [Bacillota bacterium]
MRRVVRKIFCVCLAAVMGFGAATTAQAAAAPVREKLAALTFDDGPNGSITTKLLDALAARGVKCTFFLLGQNAKNYPDIVRRIYNEGHQIGNHTWSHYALTGKSDAVIRNEVESTRALLESITGQHDFLVRLPYGDGDSSSRVLNQAQAPVIAWNVDSSNGGRAIANEATLYNGIINNVRDGSIILLHDFNAANMNAALRAIDTLRKQGYSFVTVNELFRLRNVAPVNNKCYINVSFGGTFYDESRLSQHWAYSFLTRLNSLGVLQGDGAGLEPNAYLTRAMAVTLLWRGCGAPGYAVTSTFQDVLPGEWYAQAVAWGEATGAVQGYSATLFGPFDLMSREQFAALLIRLAQSQGRAVPQGAKIPVYSDRALTSGWAVSSLNALWKSGFVSKNDASVFRPGDSITRAEAAELVCWYLGLE